MNCTGSFQRAIKIRLTENGVVGQCPECKLEITPSRGRAVPLHKSKKDRASR